MTQFALFTEAPQRSAAPTPESVRARLEGLLDELRRADVMPWTETEVRRWSVVVPQMCKWLPDEECADRLAVFSCELSRLSRNRAA